MDRRKTTLLVVAACCAPCVSTTVGAKEMTWVAEGSRVWPVRVAACALVDGRVMRTGDWIAYSESSRGCCSTQIAFDAFQAESSCPTSGPIGGECAGGGDPTSRWYFGPSYCNGAALNDMNVVAGTQGRRATRIQFAWFWGHPEEAKQIAVFTGEDFAQDCTGFGESFPGVLYDFGLVGCNGGYCWADVQLCEVGLAHQLPSRESGWYVIQFLTNDGQDLATCAQPMLWGPRDPVLHGSSGPLQLDDDAPRDGALDLPTECYSYAFGVCPSGNLAAMMAFYAGDDEDPCAENGCVSDACTLTKAKCKAARRGHKLVVKGALPEGASTCVRIDGAFASCATGDGNNKFKVVLKGQTPGAHVVEACEATLTVECL